MDAARPAIVADAVVVGRCHCGAVRWRFRGLIPDATVCNCTVCRRYGVLWAYGHDREDIDVDDPQAVLTPYLCGSRAIAFNFCSLCGNLVSWREVHPSADGRTRIAVNLRLAEPDDVAHLALQRFDGLHTFEDLPPDGRRVGDILFSKA